MVVRGLIERLGVEPVVVAGHRHDLRAGELEGLDRGQIRGLLDQHDRAGIEQRGRDQRQRLLAAGRDENLVGDGRQAARRQPRGELFAQRRVALGRRVLQRTPRLMVAQHLGERLAQTGGVKQLGCRQAARKADHARALRQRQDLAHR